MRNEIFEKADAAKHLLDMRQVLANLAELESMNAVGYDFKKVVEAVNYLLEREVS